MSRLLLLLSLVATASSYVLPAARVAQRSATHRAPVVVLQVIPPPPPRRARATAADSIFASLPFLQEDGPAPAAPEPASADVPMEPVEEEIDEGELAKEALKAEVADGLAGARPDKAVVGEILLALEARNPTRSPATSPLLNGKWKVMFASGASPGLKALTLLLRSAQRAPKSPSGAELSEVGDAFLTIKPEQPRAEASVRTRLLSFENTAKLNSQLEAESAVRLRETYASAESEYGGLKLPFSNGAQYKRSLLVSYLDDELLVVRDAFGRPDVLMRVDSPAAPTPSGAAEADGADAADDEAPGAS